MVWVFRLSQMVCFAPFFFFFFFLISAQIGPFRPIPSDSADTGRYRPSRPDLGRVGTDVGVDFSRVGPRQPDSGIATRHGRAVCGVPPASPRLAASDAGALAWEPRPCIPVKIQLNSQPTFFSFGCLEAMSHFLGQNYIFCNAGHKGHL